MDIELVDPRPFAEAAGRLLQSVWQPPCTHYSADYLSWQFGFAGRLRPLGAVALAGSDLIGFAAATPRTARFRGREVAVYLLSFVAVRADQWGRGLAAGLYARLLDAVRAARAPVVTYAFPDSPGQRALLRAYEAARFVCQSLGPFAVHGYLPRRGESPLPVATADAAGLSEMAAGCDDPAILWSAPTPDELAHYARDPRPRVLLVAREQDRPVAAGFAVRSALATPTGLEAVTVLDNLFVRAPAGLQALGHEAARRWPSPSSSSLVLIPNVRGIPPAVLRAAGLRQLPQRVEGYLCVTDPADPLLGAQATNLEVL